METYNHADATILVFGNISKRLLKLRKRTDHALARIRSLAYKMDQGKVDPTMLEEKVIDLQRQILMAWIETMPVDEETWLFCHMKKAKCKGCRWAAVHGDCKDGNSLRVHICAHTTSLNHLFSKVSLK